jgi:DNA integrity scanning protein DisA with diadenylate cyclase activity
MPLFIMYFQSLSRIMDASMEELARCPGIGERKVTIILGGLV